MIKKIDLELTSNYQLCNIWFWAKDTTHTLSLGPSLHQALWVFMHFVLQERIH